MNNKVISGIGTAVVMALIAVVLLAFGYDPPDPPVPEEGVEVNVGDSDYGLGEMEQPATQSPNYASPASNERVATQQTEESLAMNSDANDGSTTNPNASQQQEPTNKEPEINKNALFTGKRNNGGDGSQGVNKEGGNQGAANGTQNSNNYVGEGGGNGSYSLKGRSAVSLPKPAYNSNQQGKIVVDIWVDQQGRVVRVEGPAHGSTLTNSAMVEQAKNAARKARFNADTKALEEQKGTITYIFKI